MTEFSELQPGDLFHFPGQVPSVYRKEAQECMCCGGKAVAALYFTRDEDQPLIARIDASTEVVQVTDMTHWASPFSILREWVNFKLPGEDVVYVKDTGRCPGREGPCARCTNGFNAWEKGNRGTVRHFCPDTPVLRVKA